MFLNKIVLKNIRCSIKAGHKSKQDSCNAAITEHRLEVQLGPFAELRLGSRYLGVCKPKAHANQRDPQHYFFFLRYKSLRVYFTLGLTKR